MPAAGSLEELTEQLTAFYTKPHPYNTIVVDTLDALELLIWRAVCAETGVSSIEDWGGGWGKGYIRAAELWRDILAILAVLRARHHVILIGHAMVKTFQDPDQASGYDRYQLKINERAAGLVRQAVDTVLFANYKMTLIRDKGAKKGRGVGEGARVMYTQQRPAFDAKNRFNLPFEMPLAWKGFAQRVRAFYEPAPASENPTPAIHEQTTLHNGNDK